MVVNYKMVNPYPMTIHVWYIYIYAKFWGIFMGSILPYIAAPCILWVCSGPPGFFFHRLLEEISSWLLVVSLFLGFPSCGIPNKNHPQVISRFSNGCSVKPSQLVGLWHCLFQRIHGAAIDDDIYHQYTPFMLAYTIHGSYGFSKFMASFQCTP